MLNKNVSYRNGATKLCKFSAVMLKALLAGALPLCLALAGCAPESDLTPQSAPVNDSAIPGPAAVSYALRQLAGARVRVAWVQDLGDGTDTGLESASLRLMGFDTEDGLGERAVLAAPANYARPLITPRGDRVIFSDRHARKFFITSWDGAEPHALRDGLALAVWADAAGREWVYFGDEPEMRRLVPKVYRCPLDNPAQVESVWDRTQAGLNNFQISASGRYAGGVFPWPDCGVADLASGGLRVYGKGCYPALAPDDSGLFWIFDGAHRNLLFFDTRAGSADARWRVNINNVPGIDGYEVYYPRWSNRARFMVMAGPFKAGTGDNRIRGGGTGVELYLGRFAADFRAIEQWVRITYNQSADFYPDVWAGPAADAVVPAGAVPEHTVVPAVPPPDADMPPWPVAPEGLVFAWANRAAQNEVSPSDATGGVAVCKIEPSGRARYGRHFEMLLDRGAFTADDATARRALAACQSTGAFTLEMTAMPDDNGTRPPAVLFAWGASDKDWCLLLRERAGQATCTLRRANGDTGAELTLGALPPGKPSHIILSYRKGVLTGWVNGQMRMFEGLTDVALTSSLNCFMTFGAMPGGTFEWAGLIENVAVYDRALSPDEATLAYEAYVRRHSSRRTSPAIAIVDARLAEAITVPAPVDILPYRRALAVNRYVDAAPVSGAPPPREFLAAHWVILGGEVLADAVRVPGQVYRLRLEEFDARPELEGERLIVAGDHWDLPVYFDNRDF